MIIVGQLRPYLYYLDLFVKLLYNLLYSKSLTNRGNGVRAKVDNTCVGRRLVYHTDHTNRLLLSTERCREAARRAGPSATANTCRQRSTLDRLKKVKVKVAHTRLPSVGFRS